MTDVRPRNVPEARPVTPPDFRHPSLFINRELSWLEFNHRVLHEAQDSRTPLLERLKFLAIFSSNLDEFFQVRVAGLKQQVTVGYSERTADGMTPESQLKAVNLKVRDLVEQHGLCLTQEVLPALARNGVAILNLDDVSLEQREYVRRYFHENIFPVLTPLAVDPAHPFPYISNLSISIAVILRDEDGEERFARVKVPQTLDRWVPLPEQHAFVPLEQIIGNNLESLFPGVEVLGWHTFRVTRNTEYQIDHDESEDLLDSIQEEVRNRRFGEVTRLEVHPSMPMWLREILLSEFAEESESLVPWLTEEDIFEVHGPMHAAQLMSLASLDVPELRDPPIVPVNQPDLCSGRNIFDVIREGDVLIHLPYESFTTSVERFLQLAVEDPEVLAIKLTLYRTGGDSAMARLLEQAAERGKQVAVLIELQARFDEENNIIWAQRLEDIGVHVSYGVTGLKTHTKTLLVVRREGSGIRRYVHVSTGNYNARTARLYTDIGLFSADPDLGADLTDLFNVLTGFPSRRDFRKLIVAPYGMRERFVQMIRRESDHARAGEPARIIAKMNSLVDPEIISELYMASCAGVSIDLVVRGICCLRPGLRGISQNIRVISIIGRFLEHSRAFYFKNGGEEEVYIGSADWMPRNLDRRIEAVAPVESPRYRRLLRDMLDEMLQDNRQAWDLLSDGTYEQRTPPDRASEHATHKRLLEMYQNRNAPEGCAPGDESTPQ